MRTLYTKQVAVSPSAAVWSIPHIVGYCGSFLINYFRQNPAQFELHCYRKQPVRAFGLLDAYLEHWKTKTPCCVISC